MELFLFILHFIRVAIEIDKTEPSLIDSVTPIARKRKIIRLVHHLGKHHLSCVVLQGKFLDELLVGTVVEADETLRTGATLAAAAANEAALSDETEAAC